MERVKEKNGKDKYGKNVSVVRSPVYKYLTVVDELLKAQEASQITRTAIAELVGVEYIVLDKYLRKERNVSSEEVAKRMMVVAKVLNKLVKRGDLPLGSEINKRLRTQEALELVEAYIEGKTND